MLAPNSLIQNRYQIIRPIGQGGMGAVYLARDERLGHTVAIKETFFSEARLRRQFEREARLLASLRHPALPVVTDYFSDSDGDFLVMQYIPGDDLETIMAMQGRAFEPEKVLRWADEILDALEYLHTQQQPILHRDIKPSNLKLTTRDRIVLLDFGLAKGSTGVTSVAGNRSVMGYTPHYAPLEQIHGTGTDERSDLYALAATLYRLMTGTVPPDAMGRAMASVHGNADPLRPANEINKEVPEQVAGLLMRAMAQNPKERPPTASEMRRLLAEARQIQPRESVEELLPPTRLKEGIAESDLTSTEIMSPEKDAAKGERDSQKLEATSLSPDRLGKVMPRTEPEPVPQTVTSPTQAATEKASRASGDFSETPRSKEVAVGKVSLSQLGLDSASTARAPTWRRGSVLLIAVGLPLLLIGLVIVLSLTGRLGIENANGANERRSENVNSGNASSPESRPRTFTNSVGIEFVEIPAGSFMMGSTNDDPQQQPVHQVTIAQPLYMGRYEVTQAQWQAVMRSNPSGFGGDNLPVERVSWNDAQQFIRRLNAMNDGYTYRLPSEAEWEYACRARTTEDYAGVLDAMAWYANNSGRTYIDADEIWRTDQTNYGTRIINNGNQTHPVGQKQPNSFGLYDMHGNVWEWCQDWYHENYNGAPTDGSAWISGGTQQYRVVRGGSWYDLAARLRSADRIRLRPGYRSDAFGFRVVAVSRP
jgi:formylglycine-generating enzyme required for sulfatase activity/predicted Ser/Thr protein kinase